MGLWNSLFRRKLIDSEDLRTDLKRCLSTKDLVLLGLGHMIGGGIYVLAGQVAHRIAGPGVVFSFLLAGVAAVLAALCYAELGARAPRAGSAYTFIYMSLGEFPAFLIGWQLIMEHLIGASAVAKTWSSYLDSLFSYQISSWSKANFPMTDDNLSRTMDPKLAAGSAASTAILSSSPDFAALAITLVVCGFVAYGVRLSVTFNNIMTSVNLTIIAFILGYGFTFAKPVNWSSSGMLPFGFAGVMAGASRCFFAYIGFDSIATAAEETRQPSRSLPLATITSMTAVTTLYVLMSADLTLMVPYTDIDPGAAFSASFEYRGVSWAGKIVSVGAIAGITTALTGHLFTLPRCVYAMAADGLLWRPLAHVNATTQVPTFTVILVSCLCGIGSTFLNIELLIDLLAIGTLSAYAVVSCSVIKLRFCDQSDNEDQEWSLNERVFQQKRNQSTATVFLVVCCVSAIVGSVALIYLRLQNPILCWSLVSLCGLLFAVSCVRIHQLLPNEPETSNYFKVPLVPFLPAVSFLIDVLLMLSLPPLTWVRLSVWLVIGLVVYFGYGYHFSNQRMKPEEKRDLLNLEPISTIKNVTK